MARTQHELLKELQSNCGVHPGDILIIHASMKRLGWVQGGPRAVIAAVQAAVGDAGTLLMPAFCNPPADGAIHLNQTPSRTGLLSESLRTSTNVHRSQHPTHSVCAWGRRAAEFTADHEQTTGLGVNSPFHKAALAGAEVLMIGCGCTSCSLIHVAESIMRVPYLGRVFYEGYNRPITLVDATGRSCVFLPRDVPIDSGGFTAVQRRMDTLGMIQHIQLGAAPVLKFRGTHCLETAQQLLREDPAALLCTAPGCPVCPRARRIVQQHMHALPSASPGKDDA